MQKTFSLKLHIFALITTAVAVFLIVAGATVTSTGTGDAVPDWPLSYGTLNPPMVGGIFYEHGHRLIAGLTAILIAILAFWLYRSPASRLLKRLGFAALAAVIVQAVLGGLRVLLVSTEAVQDAATAVLSSHVAPVKVAVTVAHASLAQTILCLLFAIALFTSESWLNSGWAKKNKPEDRQAFRVGVLMVVLVFCQLVIGAVVRHTGAGLIIPDFPLSFGSILPPFGGLPNNPNAPFPISDSDFAFKVALHFLHRVVGFTILGVAIYIFYKFRTSGMIGRLSVVLLILTCMQVLLGALNIWTGKAVPVTVTHVVTGALILGTSVIFALWSHRLTMARPAAADKSSGTGIKHSEAVA